MSYSAVVVPADIREPVRREQIGADSLADLQRLVGGYVQVLRVPDGEVEMWVNEDGKAREPRNDRATALMEPGVGLFKAGQMPEIPPGFENAAIIDARAPGDDYVAGDVVLTGNGEGQSCPEGYEDRHECLKVVGA